MSAELSEVLIRKAATDGGFDKPAQAAQGGWLLFGSCDHNLLAWARPHQQGGALALSKPDVFAALAAEFSQSAPLPPPLPQGAAGGLELPADCFYFAIARAVALELSLPNRPEEEFLRQTANIPQNTEAERLRVERIGQNIFRKSLLEYWGGKCAVSGLAVEGLLRASHIKPWSECGDASERLNVFNGLLLAPHLDALFDGGWLSFNDDGAGVFSAHVNADALRQLGLKDGLALTRADARRKPFLAYHRRHVFRDNTAGRVV